MNPANGWTLENLKEQAAAEAAKIAAAAKLAEDKTLADAKVAAETKLAEAKIAAQQRLYDFYKTVMLPIVLAALVATPGIISAYRVSRAEGELQQVKKTGIDTHTLVNSNMGFQLNVSAVALRKIANATKDPEDIAAALLAERLLKEHIAKQAIVDAAPHKGNGKEDK
jgi:hypothetical protein